MKKKAAKSTKKSKTTAKKTARTATKKKTTASKTKKKTSSKKTATRTAAKPTTRKKTTAKTAAKKTTAKKTTAKKTAKKKTVKKQAAGRKPAVASAPQVSRPVAPMRSPEPQPQMPSAAASPTPTPQPPAAPAERPLGVVTHYYSHLGVAVIQLNEERLRVGETIHIKGHTTDLKQTIESIEIDHQSVPEAAAGQVFGLKVRDHVREHDQIYKVSDQTV